MSIVFIPPTEMMFFYRTGTCNVTLVKTVLSLGRQNLESRLTRDQNVRPKTKVQTPKEPKSSKTAETPADTAVDERNQGTDHPKHKNVDQV